MTSFITKGRGSQKFSGNKFQELNYDFSENQQGELDMLSRKTQFFYESPKNIISKNDSEDLRFDFSINPYQGCEHGCIYCYARNSHEYWGFNSGIDFESKIVVKETASQLLEKKFLTKSWKSTPVMLSGNTDCYQPIERKLKLTRSLLEVFNKYKNPVSIITKNSLIVRDIDILSEMAEDNLVHVILSITTMDESLRQKMEPRTSSGAKRLGAIRELSDASIPTGVMTAPIIPGLNDQEIPEILSLAAKNGAQTAAYTMVRLNGAISTLFKDWLKKYFPDRYDKVINQISDTHDGTLNDSTWGRRLKGTGNYAAIIEQLFKKSYQRHFSNKRLPGLDVTKFRKKGNYQLF